MADRLPLADGPGCSSCLSRTGTWLGLREVLTTVFTSPREVSGTEERKAGKVLSEVSAKAVGSSQGHLLQQEPQIKLLE